MRENFSSVQQSQFRMQAVTGINTATRFCLLVSTGVVARTRAGLDYLAQMQGQLDSLAVQLQYAQTNLSQTVYDFSDDNKDVINSKNITLFYNVQPVVGDSQTVNAWAAAIQLAVAAFKAKNL